MMQFKKRDKPSVTDNRHDGNAPSDRFSMMSSRLTDRSTCLSET